MGMNKNKIEIKFIIMTLDLSLSTVILLFHYCTYKTKEQKVTEKITCRHAIMHNQLLMIHPCDISFIAATVKF